MPSAPPPDWVLARRRAIGDRIRDLRRARRLSQEKLAEIAGLDRQSVNRIEQGHQAALLDNLIRILAALEAPFGDLD
ncbi:helix-turn-helix transcriptional regulator [Streptomyces sp. LUP30]|uniref:helix-turn-helix transcriptional regulator n=1 Tax=Streptomyces sp. LUP30 TaxID=1890285 RepID=UPI0008517C0E|nr:helix-turn-helix transcriptional regulator [Streptomyces sp. LUP30]